MSFSFVLIAPVVLALVIVLGFVLGHIEQLDPQNILDFKGIQKIRSSTR